MSELIIDQSLSQKRIGLKQEQSLKILQKGFVELTAQINEAEAENPFLDVVRNGDATEHALVRYQKGTAQSGYSSRGSGDMATLSGDTEVSLQQHLKEQLSLTRLSVNKARIAERIIDGMDGSGYYLERLSDAARELGEDVSLVKTVLTGVVQRFEPAGVGARDISECLLLQLSDKEKTDELLVGIIGHELMLVAQNKLGVIAKKYSADKDAVKRRCVRLRQLNPKPGGTFAVDVVKYVFPDVIVEMRDGQRVARLTEEEMLSVSVNGAYVSRMLRRGDDAAKEYVSKKARQAEWICQCIRRRRDTLQRIANHIIVHQSAFFDSGQGHICPMTMKRMAEDIGVHESTVSRGVSGKYLQCRWGVFALKYFFSADVNGISAEAVKQRIKSIVAAESKTRPLSDRRIAEILQAESGEIARRTVSKYRSECHIPPASQRRQH